MKETIQQMLKNYWVDGVILLILGLIMLLWPGAALKIVCILVGIALLVLGGLKLLDYYKYKGSGKNNDSDLPVGIIQMVAGLLLIILGSFFIAVFFILAGIAMLAGCILMFMRAYQLRNERGTDFITSIIIGVIILIVGIIMIINPAGTAQFLVQMVGVVAIIIALWMFYSAYKGNA